MSELVLRSYFRSSCSWRVRIVLAVKGLDYRYEAVHLVKDGGEQHRPEHKRLNPMAQVPVLLVDGEPLSQSVAIAEYLEQRFPQPPLLPPEALDRARVRQLMELVNSGIQPLQNLRTMTELMDRFGIQRPGAQEWSAHWIGAGFRALEAMASRWSGRYLYGDSLSLADAFLVPQLYNARRFGVDLSPFPTLLKVGEVVSALPAFEAAHPDRQPDAPPPLA